MHARLWPGSRIFGAGVTLAATLAACHGSSHFINVPRTPTASPSAPAPSSSPATPNPSSSATPTPSPLATPNLLVFDATAPSAGTFTVSETGYGGAFNATMACVENPAGQSPSSDAYVAQFSNATTTSTQTPASAGGTATFTVDSGAETGSCQVAIDDSAGNTASVTVTVSTTGLTIQ